MVFLLGRMGNNRQALNLIIDRLGDVNRVSWFQRFAAFFSDMAATLGD